MSEKSCDTCLYQGPFNKDECYAERCDENLSGWRDREENLHFVEKITDKEIDNSFSLNKLIDDHWKYVEDMLRVHGTEEEAIAIVGFHYKSAFRHGFKHCMEHYEIEDTDNE